MISCACRQNGPMALLFQEKKAPNKTVLQWFFFFFCGQFRGLLRHFISLGEGPFTRLLRTAPYPPESSTQGSNLKAWNFIPADKSKSAVCSRWLRHVPSRAPSCFPVTDARDIFHSKCPLHRPQAVGISIFGGPPPCTLGCQPDSALIEDSGDPRYYSKWALISHTLQQFHKAERHLTP